MIQERQEALPELILARRLASFCPSSLSLDDMQKLASPKKVEFRKVKEFIRPSSSVSVIREEAPKKVVSFKSSRFACLLGDVKQEGPTIQGVKLRYELPNLARVSGTGKQHNKLLVVELSAKETVSASVSQPASEDEGLCN